MTAGGLILMALASSPVRVQMEKALVGSGLRERLGDRLFAPENWHQSLSGRYTDCSDTRQALMRVGSKVSASAAAFTITLNRVNGNGGSPQGIHWAFLARGRPKGFVELLSAIRAALESEGCSDVVGHSPHVTVSYQAPEPLSSLFIEPIEWSIDEFVLVRGGGRPYRYEVLQRWPLTAPPAASAVQLNLLH